MKYSIVLLCIMQCAVYAINNTNRIHPSLYADYARASFLRTTGKTDEALQLYKKILRKHPTAYAWYDGYLRTLAQTNKYETIARLCTTKKALRDWFANDLEIALIMAQAYLTTNRDAQAQELLQTLNTTFPNDTQICYYYALTLLKNNDPNKFNYLACCIANPHLKNKQYLFYFLQSKALAMENNLPDALQAIEKSLDHFPYFDRSILLKAMLMEQHGNINEAITGYKRFLHVVGYDAAIEKQLMQLLFSQERFVEIADYLQQHPQDDAAYFFNLALSHYRSQNYTQALDAISQALTKDPSVTQTYLLKAELLLSLGRPEDARNFVQSWAIKTPENESALRACLLLRNTSIGITGTIKTLQVITIKTDAPLAYALLGDLYAEQKQFAKSIDAYKKILAHKTIANLTDVYYHISYNYLALHDYKNFAAYCKLAIDTHQAHAGLYHLMAYHYGKQPKTCTQALTCINKALAEEPNNPHYLDTKGIILLSLGKKDEALATLHRALTLAPHDTTIQTHVTRANGATS